MGATKAYTDYQELLNDPEVDAVEIITPHYLHAPMGMEALEARKHVSVQKPMATTMEECNELIAVARRNDHMFRTFEKFQYYPPLVRAKELLVSGAIGEPRSIRMKVILGTKEGWEIPYERWSWRFDPEKGSGGRIMLDYGSHLFAIALTSWAMWKKCSPGFLTLRFSMAGRPAVRPRSCGNTRTQRSTEASKYVPEDEWFEITGSRGFIWVNRCSSMLLDAPPVVVYRDGVTTNYSDMDTDWSTSFIAGCNEFVDCILAGRPARMTRKSSRCATVSNSLPERVEKWC